MGTAGCKHGCFFARTGTSPIAPRSIHSAINFAGRSFRCSRETQLRVRPRSLQRADDLGEYVVDICKAAESYGQKTLMVTNGYITREAFSRYFTITMMRAERGP